MTTAIVDINDFLPVAVASGLGEVGIMKELVKNLMSSRDYIVEQHPAILKDGRALAGGSNRLTTLLQRKGVELIMIDDRYYGNELEIRGKVKPEVVKTMALESMSNRYERVLDALAD